MVLDQVKFIANAVRKQAKIAHLDDCQFIALKVDEIPDDIAKKIADQYDEKYTADSDVVLFARGPIDKKKIKKIFNCVDKALGGSEDEDTNANLLTDKDFKLLNINGESADDIADTDEVSDEEVENALDADDADNGDAVEGALDADVGGDDAEETDDADDAEEVNEAGMSIDDILKQGEEMKKRYAAEQAARDAERAERNRQKITSVWIKKLDINRSNENKSVAYLEVVYTNGEVKQETCPIGTTGSMSDFGRSSISGERYQQRDESYVEIERQLKKAFKKYNIAPTDEDVRVAKVRRMFNDWRIKWYYGKDKKTDPIFAFSRSEDDMKKEIASDLKTSMTSGGLKKNPQDDDGVWKPVNEDDDEEEDEVEDEEDAEEPENSEGDEADDSDDSDEAAEEP